MFKIYIILIKSKALTGGVVVAACPGLQISTLSPCKLIWWCCTFECKPIQRLSPIRGVVHPGCMIPVSNLEEVSGFLKLS